MLVVDPDGSGVPAVIVALSIEHGKAVVGPDGDTDNYTVSTDRLIEEPS